MKIYNTERFENMREDLKMSKTKFCKTFNINPKTYNRFLNQKRMHISTVYKLVDKLNMSYSRILCDPK